MDVTRPTTVEPDLDTPPLGCDVDAYLDRLTAEQNKFLGAIAAAGSMLDTPELAAYASIHARLNQEFLDAQRALIKRRAEAIATARRFESRFLHPSNGVSVPRSAASPDHDELARLIDGVFEPDAPDGAAMRAQLRNLLDGWWQMEVADSDTIEPRVAPAVEVAAAPDDQPPAVERSLLPDVLDEIDTVAAEDLSTTLTSMFQALGGAADDPRLVTPQQAFDGFWQQSIESAEPEVTMRPRRRRPTWLLPVVGAVSALAIILIVVR